MVPTTIGGLLAAMCLVLPGLAYRLVREQFRAPRKETSFREVALLISTGILASAVAIVVLTSSNLFNWLHTMQRWLGEGTQYAAANLSTVILACALEVVLATAFALLAAGLAEKVTQSRAEYRPRRNVDPALTRFLFPPGESPAEWVTLHIKGGDVISGRVITVDDEDELDQRYLILDDPQLETGDEGTAPVPEKRVLIKVANVEEIWVSAEADPQTEGGVID